MTHHLVDLEPPSTPTSRATASPTPAAALALLADRLAPGRTADRPAVRRRRSRRHRRARRRRARALPGAHVPAHDRGRRPPHFARYGWELVAPDGTVAVAGTDVVTVADDGRSSRRRLLRRAPGSRLTVRVRWWAPGGTTAPADRARGLSEMIHLASFAGGVPGARLRRCGLGRAAATGTWPRGRRRTPAPTIRALGVLAVLAAALLVTTGAAHGSGSHTGSPTAPAASRCSASRFTRPSARRRHPPRHHGPPYRRATHHDESPRAAPPLGRPPAAPAVPAPAAPRDVHGHARVPRGPPGARLHRPVCRRLRVRSPRRDVREPRRDVRRASG